MSRRTAVIGGGASGLAAAIAAARAGAEVTVLERLPRVGKKLLLTGNGRCNLSHTPLDFAHYHGTVPQAAQILAQFDTAEFFRSTGLRMRTDAEGRQYPYSMTAASVLDALRLTAEQCGVQTVCGCFVRSLTPAGGRWQIGCETAEGARSFSADAVIAAAGGSAAPACGTDGSLLPVLERLGHRVVRPLPALCPVPVRSPMLRQLKGLRIRAAVSAVREGSVLRTEAGEDPLEQSPQGQGAHLPACVGGMYVLDECLALVGARHRGDEHGRQLAGGALILSSLLCSGCRRLAGTHVACLVVCRPYGTHPTLQPAVTKSLGVSSTRRPSLSSAERIMPSLTTPLSLRGSKLAMKQTCLPTSFSGSV